jgi:MFS family permease
MTAPGSRARSPARPLPVMTLLVTLAGTAAFGDAAAMITLMLRLYRTADASWAVTALLFAILGPSAVLAPVTARILARVGVWRALALTSAGQAAASAALIAVHGTGPTLVLVAVIGAGLSVTQPALLEITPAVVGPGRLDRANSLTRSASWSGWMVGPVAGGALCAAGLPWAALGIEAGSFVIAGACFGALRGVPAASRAPARGSAPGAWRYILRDRALAGLIAAVAIINVCVCMTGVAEVFFARDALRTGSVGFAFLDSVWFAGIVAGTLAAPRAAAWRPSVTVPAGIGLAGAGILAASAAGSLAAAQAAYAVAGIGFGLQATLVRGLIQRRADGPMRGGVCGVWVAVDMATQLGGYLAGGAAMLAGARPTLAIAGAGLCSAGCVAFVLAGRSGLVLREVQYERS